MFKIISQNRWLLMSGLLFSFLLAICNTSLALDNGLARTPPMGWNSWNRFGCDVSEKLIKEMADAVVSSGMKDAGYVYIVIDDCWQVSRDPAGNIVADVQRFPSGMKALAEYIHSKGLKFGLYSCAGTATCQGRPGSHGYEEIDAKTYAEWSVDYFKYDWCHAKGLKQQQAYAAMRDALAKSGREMVFSMWAPVSNMKPPPESSGCWRQVPAVPGPQPCQTTPLMPSRGPSSPERSILAAVRIWGERLP